MQTEIRENRTLPAAAAVMGFAMLIGFIDNLVPAIADELGLWQFHLIRTTMALPVFALAGLVLGLRLRPLNPRAVAARSLVHGIALMIYFGCLAFMSVAEAAAGMFTAPIFVLILSKLVYGHALGPVRVLAVGVGFLGVLLMLTPGGGQGPGWLGLLPVAAGALYALGNLATREWCPGENALTLTLGFFLALGLGGLFGTVLFTALPLAVPEGAAGFALRGWVWPSGLSLVLIAATVLGGALGMGLLIRGYQLAEASRVSIFEYAVLPVAALWGWLIWGQSLSGVAVLGMALIALAGSMTLWRGREVTHTVHET